MDHNVWMCPHSAQRLLYSPHLGAASIEKNPQNFSFRLKCSRSLPLFKKGFHKQKCLFPNLEKKQNFTDFINSNSAGGLNVAGVTTPSRSPKNTEKKQKNCRFSEIL